MNSAGFLRYASNVSSFQITPDDFIASEYRGKLAKLPALRFQTSARLGPVMFRLASTEWHAAQARKARAPSAASPSAVRAGDAGRRKNNVTAGNAYFIANLLSLRLDSRL